MCFGCYGKGHVVTDCTKKRICEKCKGSHPTSLHDQSKVKPVKFVNVVCEESSINMCIVPVMLRHKDAKSDVLTYALLDSCSQGTFIDKDLINELCIQGEEISLTVKTLNCSSCEPTTVVKELEVRGFQHSASDSWNLLPVTYSRVSLPIDKEEIPTPVKIKNWSHLQGIAGQPSVLSSLKVDLLIGSNCPKLIEPLTVIPSCEDGSFAFRTRLGWCIAGPSEKSLPSSSSVSCHRASINTNSCIVKKQQIEDTGLQTLIRKLYDIDKVPGGPLIDNDRVSQNDLKFGKREVGKHYELPLPFASSDPSLPNNYSSALKRLLSLRKKFLQNHSLFVEYKTFINGMTTKGFASKGSGQYSEGKNWFILHHGVYHSTKKKLRVVFDCSSNFQGSSLNNNNN